MITSLVLVAFALMLLLPCATALLANRVRSSEENYSAYSDRIVAASSVSRPLEIIASAGFLSKETEDAPSASISPEVEINNGLGDPQRITHPVNLHQARIERNRIEALVAQAIAARAHANSLGAQARLANAQAEAAEAEAITAEEAASGVIQEVRRAA